MPMSEFEKERREEIIRIYTENPYRSINDGLEILMSKGIDCSKSTIQVHSYGLRKSKREVVRGIVDRLCAENPRITKQELVKALKNEGFDVKPDYVKHLSAGKRITYKWCPSIKKEAADIYSKNEQTLKEVAAFIAKKYERRCTADSVRRWYVERYSPKSSRLFKVSKDVWKNAKNMKEILGKELWEIGLYLEGEGVPQSDIDYAIMRGFAGQIKSEYDLDFSIMPPRPPSRLSDVDHQFLEAA